MLADGRSAYIRASRRIDVLGELQPIAALSGARREELAGLCSTQSVERGGDPFQPRGLTGQSVYLLAGELKLGFPDGSFRVVVGGSEDTRWPLGKRAPAPCAAKAITPVELIRIDDKTLDIMMTWDQMAAVGSAAGSSGPSPDWSRMAGAFRAASLTDGALSRLPAACIDELLRRFERVSVESGQVVVQEGDAGDYYYVIESGRCAVTRRVGGGTVLLAELKSGDAFGEEALVAGSVRNATVAMINAGVLLRLAKDDFIELLREPLLRRVDWPEAVRLAAGGALWLDVRYPSEYRNDRLPGAISVPLNEIRNAIGVLDRGPEYLVYCQSGRRSSAAAFLLAQWGYRAYWLADGLQARAAAP